MESFACKALPVRVFSLTRVNRHSSQSSRIANSISNCKQLVILCAEPKVSSIYYEIIIVLILENDYLKRTREMNVLSEKEQR